MALTNAQKQARYGERHLGVESAKTRGQFFVNANTRAQIGRLGRREDYTLIALIEELAGRLERRLTANVSGKGSSRITRANSCRAPPASTVT